MQSDVTSDNMYYVKLCRRRALFADRQPCEERALPLPVPTESRLELRQSLL